MLIIQPNKIKTTITQDISNNRISLTEALAERFNSFYKDVNNKQALNKAYMPYYHLKSDIWDINWSIRTSDS